MVTAVAAFTGHWSGNLSQSAHSGQKAVYASCQSLALMIVRVYLMHTAIQPLDCCIARAESAASCCQHIGSKKHAIGNAKSVGSAQRKWKLLTVHAACKVCFLSFWRSAGLRLVRHTCAQHGKVWTNSVALCSTQACVIKCRCFT